ncbi:metallo-beta-lactamase domain protein [Colletotrichum tofieldiae]|uniref:Metallo-beta-lactamase domain protein n=1 Tax=Colletotrichum tofieldiae TaxID=708197 RepID=A0A166XZ92_9PEZI|nr:metallo-beta-lactamase domain protein [Colletotrichum tofieldiae]GKT53093.1 metallo-beta-lactamase domain protein [Colletotrichum tofieldiae]GKT81070.1 metallo-beta-lactamase domain protein [Colletotrichum tofieldiae]GKT88512.1 metallo-beta-lactamase domain protein [Colletotrichum tofieldiae]
MAAQVAVYLCRPIPTALVSPDPSSKDSGYWSPLCCTLIYTPASAILVDCPPSVDATNELASWVRSTLPPGCVLKHFVASHAHGDHFFGFPVLKTAFPSVTATGTKSVVKGIAQQYSPQTYKELWEVTFPPSEAGTSMPEAKAEFVSLPPSNELDLDGYLIKAYDVPHGDMHANSFLHVSDLGLVVASDIVYNGDCHQWLVEANTQEKRDGWMEAVKQIEALRPRIVVPGHTFKPMSEPDEAVAMSMLDSTKKYIKVFEEELKKAESEVDLFNAMRARFSRWNLWILREGCRAGIASKQPTSGTGRG